MPETQIQYREGLHRKEALLALPPFSLLTKVTAETAKQDHIHVTLGEWIINGSTEDKDALRNRMGAPLVDVRNGDAESVMAAWGRIFKRPQRPPGASRPPVGIRRRALQFGSGEPIPPPLFSGNWTFNSYYRADEEERPTHTRLKLHLNPTRYARYQPFQPIPRSEPGSLWPEPRLFAFHGAAEVNGEIVLNNNDNWIPDTKRMALFTNPARWGRHLRTYLNAVPALFEAELNRLNAITPLITWECAESLNLHSAETYWEFASENPTALVASLRKLLNSFTKRRREANLFRQDCDSKIDHNSLSLRAEINPGRDIQIYAKTNRRVRIEVVHTFTGGESEGHRLEGGHTANSWDRLPMMIESLAKDAAELVNRLFEHFRNQSGIIPAHIPAYQLLYEIGQYSCDLGVGRLIASLLVHNQCHAAGGGGKKMQGALQRLSGAGVLEHDAKTGNYTVSAPYRHALRRLQENGNFSLLTFRERRRPGSS